VGYVDLQIAVGVVENPSGAIADRSNALTYGVSALRGVPSRDIERIVLRTRHGAFSWQVKVTVKWKSSVVILKWGESCIFGDK
jgi:hypothetical protein